MLEGIEIDDFIGTYVAFMSGFYKREIGVKFHLSRRNSQ